MWNGGGGGGGGGAGGSGSSLLTCHGMGLSVNPTGFRMGGGANWPSVCACGWVEEGAAWGGGGGQVCVVCVSEVHSSTSHFPDVLLYCGSTCLNAAV